VKILLTKDFKYPDTKAHEFVITRLKERGVDLHQLAKIAFFCSSSLFLN
jgi:hypothetical protein